jgi:hypothetical protein
MKCPFRCNVITKEERNNPDVATVSKYEEYATCYYSECPFYVTEQHVGTLKQSAYCKKAENIV